LETLLREEGRKKAIIVSGFHITRGFHLVHQIEINCYRYHKIEAVNKNIFNIAKGKVKGY
jgi:hypothetical protein